MSMTPTTPASRLADCVSLDDFRATVRDLMPGESEQVIDTVAANMRTVIRAHKFMTAAIPGVFTKEGL